MRKYIVAGIIMLLVIAAIGLWLKERPIDKFPEVSEGAGAIAFDPKLGPKTVDEVKAYVEGRTRRNFRGRIEAGDEHSPEFQHARAEAVDTLKRRWGFTPEMSQEEIGAVLKEHEAVWESLKHKETLRYKIRTWLGMNS